jgi:cysteine desulfurase family protein (TIGR01976 family)
MSVSVAQPIRVPAIEDVRARFPALQSDFVFLENAGGSQVPGCVADAIRDYMVSSYVQVGATYPASKAATQTVAEAHAFMETWMNAEGSGKVVLGPSATALINLVANAYGDFWQAGDEVIVAESNHEANAGPWVRLERRGMTVKFWKVDPESFEFSLSDLDALMTPKTRLVAFPQVSNLLGEIVDVPGITRFVHERGARVFVDGVAYAPHGVVDVKAWGVDWYVFSNYKVYGPHMASLYGSTSAFADLTGPNHVFIAKDALPSKWELGALNHEGCAGMVGLQDYVRFLAGTQTADRNAVVRACETMTALENPLTAQLIGYLSQKSGVRVIGPGANRPAVGTISFISDRVASPEVPERLAAQRIGIRAGHMYAVRLCEALGIDLATGVVRVSLLHYNTPEEINRTIEALEQVL